MPKDPAISIVDDDEAVREAIRSLLRSAGFRVELFPSGKSFLESVWLQDTACLILDVRMPGMDGLELRRHLATANYRIPVIFMTAHSQEEARVQALREDVVGFLRKPFSEDVLLDAVCTALRLCGSEFA